MSKIPKSTIGVVKDFANKSDDIKTYFNWLERILGDYGYEVALAYLFFNVEKAQNRAIYCGLVKLHSVDKEIAQAAVDREHMTRQRFRELFESVFSTKISPEISKSIKFGEETRDKLMHGKSVSPGDLRRAIVEVLEYAEQINQLTNKAADFRPFGDLRGFKGAGKSLLKTTSRLVVKGIGFSSLA